VNHQPKHTHQEDIVLLRGEHPDPLTDKEWVTLMNVSKGTTGGCVFFLLRSITTFTFNEANH
jgi:hypothetical protein